jgi:hypothetical protein
MTPSCVPDLVAGSTQTGNLAGSGCRVHVAPTRVANVALAVCALMLALGATTAQALFFRSAISAAPALPRAPSGTNHLVLNQAANALALPAATLTGAEFSADWHIAFD